MEGANERRTGEDISMRKYQNIKISKKAVPLVPPTF